jgi:hypothetical protein
MKNPSRENENMETKHKGKRRKTKKGRSTRDRIRHEVNKKNTQSNDDISLEEAINMIFPKLFNIKLCPSARLKGLWGEQKQTSTDSHLDKR